MLSVAVVVLVATFARICAAQCLPAPYVPDLPGLSEGQADLVRQAMDMLSCCATCTSNDEIADVVEDILEKLEEGDVFVQEGDDTWRAYTAADDMCGGVYGAYTLDPGNSLVINSLAFTDWVDPVATATMLAGALAHEQLHAALLVTTANHSTTPPTYGDPCAVYENEVFAHEAELFLLNCLVACNCLDGLTQGGATNLTTGVMDVSASRDVFATLFAQNC